MRNATLRSAFGRGRTVGPVIFPVSVFLSRRLRDEMFDFALARRWEYSCGLLLGAHESHQGGDMLRVTTAIVLPAAPPRSRTVFSEKVFLEAFQANQMKSGELRLLGWFVTRRGARCPMPQDITTHERYFRKQFQVLALVDGVERSVQAFRFVECRPQPVHLAEVSVTGTQFIVPPAAAGYLSCGAGRGFKRPLAA